MLTELQHLLDAETAAAGLQALSILIACLSGPLLDSAELYLPIKKLFIRRYCVATGSDEAQLVLLLAAKGHLPADAPTRWEHILNVRELLAAASERDGSANGHGESASPQLSLWQQQALGFTRCLNGALGLPALTPRRPKKAVLLQPAAAAPRHWTLAPSTGLKKSAKLTPAERAERDAQAGLTPTRPTEDVDRVPVDASVSDGFELLRRLRVSNTSKTARKGTARDAPKNDFRSQCERAYNRDPTLTSVDLTADRDLLVLSSEHKRQCIEALAIAAREACLEDVRLDALEIDLACAPAIASLLSAPNLRVLTVARNKLGEAQLQLIAAALRNHPRLTELSVGDQNEGAISVKAIETLLDAMETVPSLVKLRLGIIKDEVLRRRYLSLENKHIADIRRAAHEAKMAVKAEEERVAREEAERLAAEGGGAEGWGIGWLGTLLGSKAEAPESAEQPAPEAPKKKTMWQKEAEAVASNAEKLRFGAPRNDGKLPHRDPATHYVLTGCAEWRSATQAERLAMVEAFGSNERFTTVVMNDCQITDELAAAWASVLSQSSCVVESLSLESNPFSSKGIGAIAEALPRNSSLRELKMLNLFGRVSQQAEEALADALEHHAHLTKLAFAPNSLRAKDLVKKYLTRNEKSRRESKGWNNAADPRASGALWDADWRPEMGGVGEGGAPMVRAKAPHGQHVGAAREMWDSFIGSGNADVSEEVDGGVLYEPTALPEVDLSAEQQKKRIRPARHLDPNNPDDAADLARLAEEEAREEAMGGERGDVDSLALGNAVIAAAAKKQAGIQLAVASLEEQRDATKKAALAHALDGALSSNNGLANAVVLAARENRSEIEEAVSELEARRAAHEKEEALLKKKRGNLNFMLETTGQLTSRMALSARGAIARSRPKTRQSQGSDPAPAPASADASPALLEEPVGAAGGDAAGDALLSC